MGQPVITGSTADDLSITVTLQFTADTIPNTVPNYRVMLLGQYTGDEQISNAAEDTTAANTQPLKGQYVTLAALEKPVYSSGTEFCACRCRLSAGRDPLGNHRRRGPECYWK